MRTLKLSFFAVLVVVLVSASALAADQYKIDPNHSSATFSVRHNLISNVPGRFSEVNGTINYDQADVTKSSVEAVIKVATINTDNEGRDKHLKRADFFDAEKYPTLSFRSINVKTTATDSLEVTGDLTIHSITKRITVPVKNIGARVLPGIGEFAGFEATFDIDRRDYGIFGTRWSGNTVAIDPVLLIHLIIGGVRH